jgi:hypothetical protein
MTKTTPTSSLSTVTLEALFDELEKIAESQQPSQRSQALKNALKTVALVSAGSAAGTGVAMLGHEVLRNTIGPYYSKLTPTTKLKILAPALALASTALVGFGMSLNEEMKRRREPNV